MYRQFLNLASSGCHSNSQTLKMYIWVSKLDSRFMWGLNHLFMLTSNHARVMPREKTLLVSLSSPWSLCSLRGWLVASFQPNQVLKVQHTTDWMAGAAAQPDVMQIAYPSQALRIYVCKKWASLGPGSIGASCMYEVRKKDLDKCIVRQPIIILQQPASVHAGN
jgi:hypothetical protein